MPTVGDVVSYLEAFAPKALAADWDNVGLLLGTESADVEHLLTCLTITPEVVAEAIDEQVQMIVTHHPILFRGTKSLSTQTAEGRLLWPLARHGIAVYSPHTAFENTAGGINDSISKALALDNLAPLRRNQAEQQYKVVVFVPEGDLERVADAMFKQGAGIIGQYSQCSFRIPGTGTFFGNENTNPTIGKKGQRETLSELRLEVVCPSANLSNVLAVMRKAHSYEEPAYDVYPLKLQLSSQGEGRVGELPNPMTLKELAAQAKEVLKARSVQVVGDFDRRVQRIAIACGAAGEFLRDAVKARADVFLSGEMRFHDYLSAQAQGIALLLPGHYATERPAVEQLAVRLNEQFVSLRAWPSRAENDPVQWL
jgi:dinuclear metal center YbgI/SA1388 family protein